MKDWIYRRWTLAQYTGWLSGGMGTSMCTSWSPAQTMRSALLLLLLCTPPSPPCAELCTWLQMGAQGRPQVRQEGGVPLRICCQALLPRLLLRCILCYATGSGLL